MEFVEADETPVACDAPGDDGERIRLVFQRRQFRVNIAHEGVKMDAGFAAHGDARAEAVHQKRLAATDAAKQIDAARDLRRCEQTAQRRLASLAKGGQFVGQLLQAVERCGLCVIER